MSTHSSKKRLSDSEIDAIVVRQVDDDTAWEEPIDVPAKPWAERVREKQFDLAAKFHVLSVLYSLGANATVSVGSERDVDITVVRRPGEVLTVDVKAVASPRSWSVREFAANKSHFVVFVLFGRSKAATRPKVESYVWPSRELQSWGSEREGIIDVQDLVRASAAAKDAWELLVPAA